MTRITPRKEWGFNGWSSTPGQLNRAGVRYMTWHYEGANPVLSQTGPGVPRAIHRFHRTKWAGIGYNYVIDSAGNIYEGRGLDYRGAHKPSGPGQNSTGIGVQLHLGGDERPTVAMLAAAAWLKAACEKSLGRSLKDTWHGEGFGTECPGKHIRAWVQRGGPDQFTATGSLGGGQTAPIPAKPGQLAVDGIYGPNTQAKLKAVLGNPRSTAMVWRRLNTTLGLGRLNLTPWPNKQTARVLQKAAGFPITGKWDDGTTRDGVAALQVWLNSKNNRKA